MTFDEYLNKPDPMAGFCLADSWSPDEQAAARQAWAACEAAKAEDFECCGKPVVGAEYMGAQELVCCGNPEPKGEAQPVALSTLTVTDEMVDRFLSWKLPDDFCPDAGITFKRTYNEASPFGPSTHEPIGTNLLTAEQARAMLEHVLSSPTHERAAPAPEPQAEWVSVPAEPTAEMCIAAVRKLMEDRGGAVAWEDVMALCYRSMLSASPSQPVAAEGVTADPLQGAADWIVSGLRGALVGDIQSRLLIGYNRAKRLYDAALSGSAESKGGSA